MCCILALWHFPEDLSGQRPTELPRAGMSFVPAICPCRHQMGTSSCGVLSGQAEGAEGQALVLPAGLSWSLQAGRSRLSGWASSRPQVPSTLGTLVPAQRGAGALPSSPFPVLDAPAASCLIAQGQASPVLTSLNVPWWPWLHVPQDTACLTGQTHWQQLSKAGPSLSWRSCPAPQNSSAGQRGRVNLPHCLPRGWFCSLCCCSPVAEEVEASLHCHSSGSPEWHQET